MKDWIIQDLNNWPLIISGIFYSIICIFSIVTGLIYMSGKRELNPLELSDKMVSKLYTKEKKTKFAKKMGIVTFFVGIIQGITSFSILKGGHIIFYIIAVGFTIFSIASVSVKLKGKINAFPIIKAIFYILILIILLLKNSRILFI